MIVISGASQNHYLTLHQFISHAVAKLNLLKHTLVIYDLGIRKEDWDKLLFKYKGSKIIWKKFDYSKYPPHFNIDVNSGEYAWKPALIWETHLENENDLLLWMDSGNIIKNDLSDLENIIKTNYIHSSVTMGDIKMWTHPQTIKLMKPKRLTDENRNGACMGFNGEIKWIKDLLKDFFTCACDKNIIAPHGSSRKNHRQDQAVFTILYYNYKDKYNFKSTNNMPGYSIHNDVVS